MKLYTKFGLAISALAFSAFVACDNSSSSDDEPTKTTVKEEIEKISKAIGLNLPKCEKDGQTYSQEVFEANMEFSCKDAVWTLSTPISEINKNLDREALAEALEDSGFDFNDFLKAFVKEAEEALSSAAAAKEDKPASSTSGDKPTGGDTPTSSASSDESEVTIDKCEVTTTNDEAIINMESTNLFTTKITMSLDEAAHEIEAVTTITVLDPTYAETACTGAKADEGNIDVTCDGNKIIYSTREKTEASTTVETMKAAADMICAGVLGELTGLDDFKMELGGDK